MDAVKILGSLLGGGAMTSRQGDNALGGLLRGALGGGESGGGLGELLGNATGGGSRPDGGGIGDLLGAALGGGRDAGGLGGMLGGALGGRRGSAAAGGGLGGILGSVAIAAIARYAAGKMAGGGTPQRAAMLAGGGDLDRTAFDIPDAGAQAELLIEAMINAAKADGRIDSSEEQNILARLDDLDVQEQEFVRAKLRSPVDAARFAARVPADLRDQVYATSLLAIELNERSEALYLRDLAHGLGLDADRCNAIHREMGEPQIFR